MRMPRLDRQRGFTLVELMTSTVVLVLVLAAVSAIFIGVQRTYQIQSQVKTVVEGGRAASTYLSRAVRLAGFGIDPRFGFDFGTAGLPGTTKDNYAEPGLVTDDLAFRYRDPAYLRRGALDATGSMLNLDGGDTFGTALRDGQALLLACKGAQTWVMVRASGAAAGGATSVGVAFYGPPPITLPAAWPPPCMTLVTGSSAAYVMLVHEERIRVVGLGPAGRERPYLVVFHNFDTPDPTVNGDFDPIAADVENFQVAYVMNRPAPTGPLAATPPVDSVTSASPPNPNWILGDQGSGTGEVLPDDTVTPVPDYELGYDTPPRYTKHPANIRGLRATVVVRSTRPLAERKRRGVPPFDVENWTTTAPADFFYRASSVTTVRTPNLAARAFFTPILRETPTDDPELNSWGS